jgi:hypothetical protein
MMKGGSILANFRLRKMEQNAAATIAANRKRRENESQAYMKQEQQERNMWVAEQERERLDIQRYQQRMQEVRLQHQLLLNRLQANQENRRSKNTKRNPKKLYRNKGTSRNLLKRRPANYIPNWGF